jgi:hypothetical protein
MGRELDRFLAVEWTEPPSTLLDVEVVVVYEDGVNERVDREHLTIQDDGVVVDGHPLRRERVLQVEIEYNETTTPVEKLVDFFGGLPAAVRRLPEDFRRWRD